LIPNIVLLKNISFYNKIIKLFDEYNLQKIFITYFLVSQSKTVLMNK